MVSQDRRKTGPITVVGRCSLRLLRERLNFKMRYSLGSLLAAMTITPTFSVELLNIQVTFRAYSQSVSLQLDFPDELLDLMRRRHLSTHRRRGHPSRPDWQTAVRVLTIGALEQLLGLSRFQKAVVLFNTNYPELAMHEPPLPSYRLEMAPYLGAVDIKAYDRERRKINYLLRMGMTPETLIATGQPNWLNFAIRRLAATTGTGPIRPTRCRTHQHIRGHAPQTLQDTHLLAKPRQNYYMARLRSPSMTAHASTGGFRRCLP